APKIGATPRTLAPINSRRFLIAPPWSLPFEAVRLGPAPIPGRATTLVVAQPSRGRIVADSLEDRRKGSLARPSPWTTTGCVPPGRDQAQPSKFSRRDDTIGSCRPAVGCSARIDAAPTAWHR